MLNNVARVVIVSGVGNTGKTTAIKQALEKLFLVINPKFPSRDYVLIGKVLVDHVPVLCGIASGGDTPEIVEDNIRAFRNSAMDLRVVVLACKSRGGSRQVAEKFVQTLAVVPKQITTEWITTTWFADVESRVKEHDRISDKIIECFRGSASKE